MSAPADEPRELCRGAYNRADRTALIAAFVVFGALGLALIAAIAWLVSRLV